jgi:hypothetical protein
MASEDERLFILEMIDTGKITAEEGLQLLQALPEQGEDDIAPNLYDGSPNGSSVSENPALPVSEAVQDSTSTPAVPSTQAETFGRETTYQTAPGEDVLIGDVKPLTPPPNLDDWRRYWMIPLWIGVGITVVGAMLMYWAQQASGVSFWFLCAGVPFTLGVILMTLAWYSRTAHWLHLRVHQSGVSWPRVIAISFPLPLGLVGWAMRTFGVRVPGMETTSVDDLLNIIKTSTTPESPLFIEVEDEEDGELVQIYIG